jgi:hypothetical protein
LAAAAGGDGPKPIFLADPGLLRCPRRYPTPAEEMDVPMNDKIETTEPPDHDLLACEIPDEALEAAANATKPVFSLVGSPTVSILLACCS